MIFQIILNNIFCLFTAFEHQKKTNKQATAEQTSFIFSVNISQAMSSIFTRLKTQFFTIIIRYYNLLPHRSLRYWPATVCIVCVISRIVRAIFFSFIVQNVIVQAMFLLRAEYVECIEIKNVLLNRLFCDRNLKISLCFGDKKCFLVEASLTSSG